MLSAVTWTGHAGDNNWSTPTNWSGNAPPGLTDNVTINALHGTTIHGPTSATAINSLTVSSANLVLDGNNLTVTNAVTVASSQTVSVNSGVLTASSIVLNGSTITLAGGTIKNATVSGAGSATVALTNGGGTLDGVTIGIGTVVDGSNSPSSSVHVQDGLTLNGSILLGNTSGTTQATISFDGTQTVSGNGTVTFGGFAGRELTGGYSGNDLLATGGNDTVTIDSAIKINGENGGFSTQRNQLGVFYGAAIDNQATVTINASGSLYLDDITTTAGLGAINAGGATVYLAGVVDNTNAILKLQMSTGTWIMDGGSIMNGDLASAGGATLQLTGGGGTLDGLTIDQGTIIDGTNSSSSLVDVQNGLTLKVSILLGNASGTTQATISFDGTQTVSGNGTVTFGGFAGRELKSGFTGNDLLATGRNDALTINNTIKINGENGGFSTQRNQLGVFYGAAIDNQATVNINAGGSLYLDDITTSGLGTVNAAGANVYLAGVGNGSSPLIFEALSQDLGAGPSNFSKLNSVYNSINLVNNTYVQLVNQGTSIHAVYVDSLNVPSGSTLDLNGLNLYVLNESVNGTIVANGGKIVQLTDQAPVLASIDTGPFNYNGITPLAITSSLTVSDPTNALLAGATVQIGGGYQPGSDAITFTNTSTIKGTWNAALGVVTLTGVDTAANYQVALRSLKFLSTGTVGSPRTISFQVDDGLMPSNSVSRLVNIIDSPVGTAHAITMLENLTYTFGTKDFGYSDPHDVTPYNFTGVVIPKLPSAGALSDGGAAVTAGEFVPVSDVTNGKVVFMPVSNAAGNPYAAFTFQVEDNSLTTNIDPTPKTMFMYVTKQLVFQQPIPATIVAGNPISTSLAVNIKDGKGNVVATDNSTVTLSISGVGTYTATAISGTATFSNLPAHNFVGTYTITATDGADLKAGPATTKVVPAAASKLVITQAPPATGTAGVVLTPAIKVAVEDNFGNIVTSDTSKVAINIATGPQGATFATGSTLSLAAVAGIATFSNLKLDTAGIYTFKVTDSTLTAATTGNVTISPAAASQLVFTSVPSTGSLSSGLASAVKVSVEDAFGNVVTSNTSAVTLAIASGPGTFASGTTTTVNAVAGLATFNSIKFTKTGTYTLKVSDGSLKGATSISIVIS